MKKQYPRSLTDKIIPFIKNKLSAIDTNMEASTEWNQKNYVGGNGVLVAADFEQEWILKWWWNNYSKHNDFPVTFIDIGMSKSARLWCESIGTVIPLTIGKENFSPKSDIPKDLVDNWEENYPGEIWSRRTAWMHKPFILLQSPYEKTLFLDIDCEVRASLGEAFELPLEEDGICMTKFTVSKGTVISSGVILVKRGSPVPTYWAQTILSKHDQCMGDEAALIEAQNTYPIHITPLPFHLNFINFWKTSSEVSVYHHVGNRGKREVLKQIR